MKKIIYLLGITVSLGFMACSGEDDLTPSLEDRNWWVNIDNPDSPLDHAIYGVYEQYKVPIFYNDTIGVVDRGGKNSFGEPDLYYEILKLNYIVSGGSEAPSALYSLSLNEEDLMDGVELLRDYVLPKLPGFLPKPMSYLLVDTLWRGVTTTSQTPYSAKAYAGKTTVAIGKLAEIKNMSQEDKMLMASAIIASPIAYRIFSDYKSTELNKTGGFFKEMTKLGKYGYSYMAEVNINIVGDLFKPPYAHWNEYGFINPAPDKAFIENELYFFPTQEQDVEDFVGLCLGFTKEEVEAIYGQYEHIMNKYRCMMEIVDLIKVE
ncbi:hypothetical protein [Butyricimonas sp.]|uniref:hypothetical protein n=1 Tax=Butyricimonas sp. TaxID=1969738 RepID=UPI0025B8A298|nr:hypothetical protein [Butyricimonas sp.]